MAHLSEKDVQKLPPEHRAQIAEALDREKRPNKYGAIQVEHDGITFDSIVEGNRWHELNRLQDAGLILKLEHHPKFLLQEAFTDKWGTKYSAISYTADFLYFDNELGHYVVEDVKGGTATQTTAFRIRWKWAVKQYPLFEFRIEVR